MVSGVVGWWGGGGHKGLYNIMASHLPLFFTHTPDPLSVPPPAPAPPLTWPLLSPTSTLQPKEL